MTRGESPQAPQAAHRLRDKLHSLNRELDYRAANRAPASAPVWNRHDGGRVETPIGPVDPYPQSYLLNEPQRLLSMSSPSICFPETQALESGCGLR